MIAQSPQEVTQLLHAWQRGDKTALDRLIPIVYHELHRLAHGCSARERAHITLQTTALVHEADCGLLARIPLTGKAGCTFCRPRNRDAAHAG